MNQEIYETYTQSVGCRFSKKQKTKAREVLQAEFETLGYTGEVQTKRNLVLKANNLIFGNIKSSKYLIMVPYDTPGRIFWPNLRYYPLDGNRSGIKSTVPTYGPVVIFYFLFLGLLYLLPTLALDTIAYLLLSTASIIIFIFIFVLLLRGFPNRNNVNRNSSGMIAAIELARSLTKDQRRQVSFIFTDRNDGRHFGSKIIADLLKQVKKNPMVVVLNCIGKGDKLVVGATNGNKKTASDMVKKYKGTIKANTTVLDNNMMILSPIAYFQKGISIAVGEEDKDGLVVNHTCSSKDNELDEHTIDGIVNMLKDYFDTLK